jgi:outer membrane protein TolC
LILKLIAASIACCIIASTAGAEGMRVPSLNDLLEIAMEANPEILAAREAVTAARYQSAASGGYPDPLFQYTHFVESIETRLGPQQDVFQIIQPIPFPGKLSLQKRVAAFDADLLEQRFYLLRLNVRRDIKTSYFTIASLDGILRALDELETVLQTFEELVGTRVESGYGNQQDILKAQVERIKLRERKLNTSRRRASQVAKLNSLLGRDPEHAIHVEPPDSIPSLTQTESELRDIALQRPELRSNELMIERNDRALSLARKKYLPDFTLGARYITIGDPPMDIPDSGRDAWNVSIGVRIPLWFGKVRNEVKERESYARQLDRNLESSKQKTFAELSDLYNQYEVAVELLGLYENDLIPRAQQALESAKAGYMSGEVDFLYLLDSLRLLLELRITLSEKRADVEKMISEIEALVGRDLVERK